jgi:two-component system, chemotaxis family, chemotaxis protein CheY
MTGCSIQASAPGTNVQNRSRPSTAPILIIEDDDDLRVMMAVMLELEGYPVVTARNGAEGLDAMRRASPRLILLDLMMPVMDGATFRRHQLADPQHADIPTLCVSACHDADKAGAQLRATAVVPKPMTPEQLLAAVARHDRAAH